MPERCKRGEIITNGDGTIKSALCGPDYIHPSLASYCFYAERLKPLLDKIPDGKGLGDTVILPKKTAAASVPTAPASTPKPATQAAKVSSPQALPKSAKSN